MKRLIIAFITWMLVGVTVTAAWAAGPAKPVIQAEMPDCYAYIGGDGITLFANASASDGGVLRYQWYVTDIENMAMIRAIDYADGDSYQVPEELGVKWYCYAAWNVAGGAESAPAYSRLIRVEFYENSPAHTHSFGQWMVTTEPTCTEAGIKTRECDCGVTERAEAPAMGHNWDAGTITREPTAEADGERTYSCLVCKATRTEPVKYSASPEKSDGTNNTAGTDKDKSTGDKNDKNTIQKDVEPLSPEENAGTSFPWWGIAAAAAAVMGVSILAVVLRRKKDGKG
ncbi:MAG: hypothetical protein KH544_05310 [Firmicutes bacterium]|nr:hypothetical protein [Bacillota bacterium]